MAVLRIVPNRAANDPERTAAFYRALFDLDVAMDMGWIVALSGAQQSIQISFATQGGSGTPVPDLSIEVEDLDAVLERAAALGLRPDYGPVNEPWGVRRFYLRDPDGTLLNVLSHQTEDRTD